MSARAPLAASRPTLADPPMPRAAAPHAGDPYAEAFEGAAVGMALIAPDRRLLRANRALRELLGMSEAELVGRAFDELSHAADRGSDAAGLAALEAGRIRRLATERRFVRGGGDIVDVRINLSLVRDAHGAPSQYVANVEDVTERRRMIEALTLSTARYKTLVEHLPDAAVMLFDRELRLHMVEGHVFDRHGFAASALEGRRVADLLPPERFADLAPEIRAALAGEHRSFDLEGPDGEGAYWVQMVPLRDGMGRVIGGMVVFRDITARRAAERVLEERARELERSNAELEQFASVASHDLSEPLRMVSSYLQLLRRRYGGELDEEADAFIDYAVDGAGRMQALIDDLLEYSRVGREERPPEPVATAELVARAGEVARAGAPEAEVIAARALPVLYGDPSLLGQLFQNLVGNAVKFVPEGRRARVEISAERAGDGMARFCVADNGIGIAREHAERIFRMFQRLHGREAFAGTGIGLAIAKKVVERHGGSIWLEPTADGEGEREGSRFCFTLPVLEQAA